MDERDERDRRSDAGPTERARGYGRLWARAMERRRERERAEREERERAEAAGRSFAYHETGGGYGGYGGTADRQPWDPERGRFGGGFSGYGGRPRGGGPYPGGSMGPRVHAGVSGRAGPGEGEPRTWAGPRWADELRAERIGPGAFRRGGPWTTGGPGRRGGRLH